VLRRWLSPTPDSSCGPLLRQSPISSVRSKPAIRLGDEDLVESHEAKPVDTQIEIEHEERSFSLTRDGRLVADKAAPARIVVLD
jgi:hypothetical protein